LADPEVAGIQKGLNERETFPGLQSKRTHGAAGRFMEIPSLESEAPLYGEVTAMPACAVIR